ncbi:MAG: phosphoribosylanthranilate isomerase [Ignavibacterium sp.]
MKIKICGTTNLDDALLCEKLGCDAIGFIFYEKSKRYINPENAYSIIKKLSIFTIKVGVFVNQNPEIINQVSKKCKLNVVQLHGNEEPELINKIDFPVIKSFRIKDNFDFNIIEQYHCNNFIFDSFDENYFGGTGKKFNWKIIPEKILSKVILSGGISINDLEYIMSELKPYGIDLVSSLENFPGKKDKIKLNEFFFKINQLKKLSNKIL